MVGIRLIVIMAIVGALIAYIADKMGSKIGKKKLSVFGLRPKYTSILLTALSGSIIAVLTISVMAIASQSARTALFGMDKLQKELRMLNSEKDFAAKALATAKEKVTAQNKQISILDAKILESTRENDEMEARLGQLNEKYRLAQSEVDSLTSSKVQLTNEVEDLEKTTAALRKGIITMREGQVYFRAGEVLYAGVLHGGLTHEENIAQVNWLLQNSNEAALQRLGLQDKDEPVQAIWINNKFIYPDGSLILSADYDLNKSDLSNEEVLMGFLTQINHNAVKAGVLPDPLTGKVGNMDAATMIDASNAIRRTDGIFTLRAYAKGNITAAGPVRVRLEVEKGND